MIRSKILSSKGIFDVEYDPRSASGEKGEAYIICPICTPGRNPKHQHEKKLAIRVNDPGDNKRWRCNHCGEGGYLQNEDYKKKETVALEIKELKKVPKLDPISERMAIWCKEKRNISFNTLSKLGVFATKKKMRKKDGTFTDLIDVLVFPSYDGDVLVDIHYRSANKLFSSEEGTTKIFWNINNLIGKKKAVITEGRFDALAIYEADLGLDAVSVPNGVSMTVAERAYFKRTGEIDQSKPLNLTYLDLHWEVFEALEEVIIATDDDPPGIKLRTELARRIGPEKCKYIQWTDFDSKDANGCLIKHGPDGIKNALRNAKDFPVRGLIKAKDVIKQILYEYDNGKQKGLSIGYTTVDPHFRLVPGHSIVINGYRQMGKTAFMFEIVLNMAVLYGWKSCLYTPENYPAVRCYDTLIEMLLGKSIDKDSNDRAPKSEIIKAANFLQEHVFFIEDDDHEGFTHKQLREKFSQMIKRYGVKLVVKDPWNTIIEERKKGEDISTFLSRELSNEVRFGRLYNIVNIICAHPKTPEDSSDKSLKPPTDHQLYGGAIWANKMHEVITIHRDTDDPIAKTTKLFVNKTKEHKITGIPTGSKNFIPLEFNRREQRFYENRNGKDICPLAFWEKQYENKLFNDGF